MIDEAAWRVQETADYLCARRFSVVTLQFPDDQLQYAARVAVAVQAACAARGMLIQAYILADTTYNPLSVDEVAAAHVNADCVVHYGRASLTKLSRLPAYFVFPEQQVDVAGVAACLAGTALLSSLAGSSSGRRDGSSGSASASDGPQRVLVFLDQPLLHLLEELKAELQALVERQQGAAAAQRLLFAAVPKRHMEPEGRRPQQQQQQQQDSCCARGGCGSQQQPALQQQEQQQQQHQPPACCLGAGACSSATASSSLPAAASSSSSDGSGSHLAGSVQTAPAQAEVPAADDGSCLHSLAGYQWRLPAGVSTGECGLVWVGAPDAPALLQLQLSYSGCQWSMVDPARLPPQQQQQGQQQQAEDSCCSGGATGPASAAAAAAAAGALVEGLPLEISRALRRRYFLVEKARDASIVGILVGTLGAAGYGDAVAGLRAAAAAAGKKSYTLLMGKPSPAKLANFPEIEVFVLVADPQGQILDSKEYLAPIITPHEAMLAWADGSEAGEWDERRYSLGFEAAAAAAAAGDAAPGSGSQRRRRGEEPRFSLLAGSYTGGGGGSGSEDEWQEEGDEEGAGGGDPTTALALHAQQALQITAAPQGRSDLVQPKSAADYLLHKRSWQGVEAPLVGAAPKAVEAAVEGRSGRAAGYVDEPARQQQQPAQRQQQ